MNLVSFVHVHSGPKKQTILINIQKYILKIFEEGILNKIQSTNLLQIFCTFISYSKIICQTFLDASNFDKENLHIKRLNKYSVFYFNTVISSFYLMLVCEDISGVSKVIPSVTCRGVKVQRLNPAVQGQGCQAGVMTLVNLKRAGVGRIIL